jgi:ParB family chromosome partitioning protein
MQKNISLSKIKADPNQPRQSYSLSDMHELTESIKENGVLNPLLLESQTDSTYLILDGERRYRVCKELGIKEVPSFIIQGPLTAEERLVKRFHIQQKHSNWTMFDQARAIYNFKKESKLTIAQIAEKLGLDAPKVHNWLSITEFTKEGQELILKENIKFTYLIYLIRIVKNYMLLTNKAQSEIEHALIDKIRNQKLNAQQILEISNLMYVDNDRDEKIKFLEDKKYTVLDLLRNSKKGKIDKMNKLFKEILKITKSFDNTISPDLLSDFHTQILESLSDKIKKILK